MNPEDKEHGVIEKLALNEELIAKLYRSYAAKFPVLNEYWSSLAAEEINHAAWIRNLDLMTKNKPIFKKPPTKRIPKH